MKDDEDGEEVGVKIILILSLRAGVVPPDADTMFLFVGTSQARDQSIHPRR